MSSDMAGGKAFGMKTCYFPTERLRLTISVWIILWADWKQWRIFVRRKQAQMLASYLTYHKVYGKIKLYMICTKDGYINADYYQGSYRYRYRCIR